MSEVAETTQFLAAREPWSLLPVGQVTRLARQATGSYVRRGTVILSLGAPPSMLHLIRSGAVEVRDGDDALVTHEEQGACFGQTSILEGRPSRFNFTAVEDTLLWSFPAEVVEELCRNDEVRRFFTEARLPDAGRQSLDGGPVLQLPVTDLITRSPITIGVDATVGEAAQLMDRERISAVIVTRGDRLAGILTDRDLRRVVARAVPVNTPLSETMSNTPYTIGADALALDALLSLVEHTIHHLPVMDGETILGMVTSGDLMRLERSSPLYLVGDLARHNDVASLAKVMEGVAPMVGRLLRQDAAAADIGRIVSHATNTLWRRLAGLAEQRLGPPPVPYCWVAFGSLARQEQALASDQDHAIITSDDLGPDDDAYFAELAEWLTAALEVCGFPRCTGDVMATNPRWRGSLSSWAGQFGAWLNSPTSEAVLNSSIFFDLRAVHGEHSLVAELQARVLSAAPRSPRFLGHLARHADDIEVPIGFLRGFVVEKQGSHRDRLDIKLGGITPIVDVARLYALRWGLPQVGTRPRLMAAAEHGVQVHNLLDAHEFLAYTRLQHQGRRVAAGLAPDNFIDPEDLSDFERRHLREAFAIVRRAQTALRITFQTQAMS